MNQFFDALACPKATLDDLSTDRIRRFLITARQARAFPLPENSTPKAVLDQLRLLRQDRPTNAAVLLFGYDPQQFLPSARITLRHTHQDKTSEETCQGTIFEAIDQAMYLALSKTGLPAELLREAIVNAVAHRDYESSAEIQLELYDDRLEVRNPGALPDSLTLAQLRQSHGSVPRNPLLAEPLYLTSYSETKGTGTSDMIKRCRKAGLPEPEFKLEDGFLTILRFQTQPETSPAAPPPAPAADPQVLALLRLLDKAGALGNAEILQGLGIKDRVDLHKRYLKPALAAGVIEPTIPDKPTSRLQKYRLTPKGTALLAS